MTLNSLTVTSSLAGDVGASEPKTPTVGVKAVSEIATTPRPRKAPAGYLGYEVGGFSDIISHAEIELAKCQQERQDAIEKVERLTMRIHVLEKQVAAEASEAAKARELYRQGYRKQGGQ